MADRLVCAVGCTAEPSSAPRPAARPSSSSSGYVSPVRTDSSSSHSLSQTVSRLSDLVAHGLQISNTLILEQFRVRFLAAVQKHAHLPRTCEHVRILDGDFVFDVSGPCRREPFDHVQRLAVEIACPIEPRLIAEMHDIDDERVALPAAARVAHPELERPRGMRTAVDRDYPDRVGKLVGHHDIL